MQHTLETLREFANDLREGWRVVVKRESSSEESIYDRMHRDFWWKGARLVEAQGVQSLVVSQARELETRGNQVRVFENELGSSEGDYFLLLLVSPAGNSDGISPAKGVMVKVPVGSDHLEILRTAEGGRWLPLNVGFPYDRDVASQRAFNEMPIGEKLAATTDRAVQVSFSFDGRSIAVGDGSRVPVRQFYPAT